MLSWLDLTRCDLVVSGLIRSSARVSRSVCPVTRFASLGLLACENTTTSVQRAGARCFGVREKCQWRDRTRQHRHAHLSFSIFFPSKNVRQASTHGKRTRRASRLSSGQKQYVVLFNLIPPFSARARLRLPRGYAIDTIKGALERPAPSSILRENGPLSVRASASVVHSAVRCTRRRFATSTADLILWPSPKLLAGSNHAPIPAIPKEVGRQTGVPGIAFSVITRTLYFAPGIFSRYRVFIT